MNALIYATSKFLKLFIIQDETPPRITRNKAKPNRHPAPAPVYTVVVDRKTLETRAANIKIYNGYKGPIWDDVRKMTNKQLLDIINDF